MNVTGFRVLVAEDEQTFGLTVTRFLQKAGHEVKICTNGKSVLKALDSSEWDVLLLDLKLPDADGVDILARVRKEHPELQTIIVTGFANVQSAIDTMRLGAFDYLTKPPNFEELGMRVEKAGEKTLLERENRRLRFQVQRNLSSDILTRSPVLQKVLRTIEMVAGARTPRSPASSRSPTAGRCSSTRWASWPPRSNRSSCASSTRGPSIAWAQLGSGGPISGS